MIKRFGKNCFNDEQVLIKTCFNNQTSLFKICFNDCTFLQKHVPLTNECKFYSNTFTYILYRQPKKITFGLTFTTTHVLELLKVFDFCVSFLLI